MFNDWIQCSHIGLKMDKTPSCKYIDIWWNITRALQKRTVMCQLTSKNPDWHSNKSLNMFKKHSAEGSKAILQRPLSFAMGTRHFHLTETQVYITSHILRLIKKYSLYSSSSFLTSRNHQSISNTSRPTTLYPWERSAACLKTVISLEVP